MRRHYDLPQSAFLSSISSHVPRRSSEAWAGYIAMERGLRNVREARTLYKRCYTRRFADGSQPAMCHAWLRFEREEGRCGMSLTLGRLHCLRNAAQYHQ